MDVQYKLVDGELIELTEKELAQRLAEEEDEKNIDRRPFANGKEIVSRAERLFAEQSWIIRKQLQVLFISTGLKPVLESETCNPIMRKQDFEDMLYDIGNTQELNSEQKQLFLYLAANYIKERRFI
jgi:hypothetical protein